MYITLGDHFVKKGLQWTVRVTWVKICNVSTKILQWNATYNIHILH